MRASLALMCLGGGLVAFGCSDDPIDDLQGGEKTTEELFLETLPGTWEGTVTHPLIDSHNDRIVLELDLPSDGTPTLEGLSGTIRFGEDIVLPPTDPDDPLGNAQGFDTTAEGNDVFNTYEGFPYPLASIGIVGERLIIEVHTGSLHGPFCEAQPIIWQLSNGEYGCVPWSNQTGWDVPHASAPGGNTVTGPDGQQVFISYEKFEVCALICQCQADGCGTPYTRGDLILDISVDLDAGVMLGSGSLGRLEAERL